MRRPQRVALVLAATVALVAATVGAVAATSGATASCTPDPSVTRDGTGSTFTVTCTVPDTTVTETATVTATATETVTVTADPTPTPTPSPTPTPTPTQTPTPPPGGGPFLPYSAGSYLYSAPSDYGPVNATLTSQMRAFLGARSAVFPKLNGLGSNAWGMVYAEGNASDPVWHLQGTNVPARLAPGGSGFHAPANLGQRITGTTDSPLIVLDLADGITVTAQKAAKAPLCTTATCTLTVGPAGFFEHASNGLDKGRPEADSQVNTASRGRIPDSMLVRGDRFAWALANHTDLGYTLETFWPETDSAAGHRLPMTGAEGGDSGWGAEGQRIGLDPTVDIVDRPGCTPEADVLVLTLQRHGAYIGDNAGGNNWVIKMEQNSSADPVSSGPFAGVSQTELSGCITAADWVAYNTPN